MHKWKEACVVKSEEPYMHPSQQTSGLARIRAAYPGLSPKFQAIADWATGSGISPIVLGWLIAALIRVATGSATVSMTTATGIVAPIAAAMPGVSKEWKGMNNRCSWG